MCDQESNNMTEILPTRTAQHCAQCTAHGEIALLKGHKKVCPFKECTCVPCVLVNNKRQIMAKQVKLKRLQEKTHGLRKRRKYGKSRVPSMATESIPSSPENKFVCLEGNLEGNEVSRDMDDTHHHQEDTWKTICCSNVEPILDDQLSQKCSSAEQWYPVSPMRFSHVHPLQLQPTPSFLQPHSPVSMATNYLSPVSETDIFSMNHIQTQPVYYTPPGYAVSLAQANQLPPFSAAESFLQPLEVIPVDNGTPQSIDAAQTLLTLGTGEE